MAKKKKGAGGGGKDKKDKAWGKANSKNKFRPQDPFYRGAQLKVDTKKNLAPRRDDDASDIPPIFGGAGMFGGAAGGALFGKPSPVDSDTTRGGDGLDAKARKRAKKRRRGSGGGEEVSATTGAASSGKGAGQKRKRGEMGEGGLGGQAILHQPEAAAPALPKQRPGESLHSYRARVDAAARQQLRPAQQKLLTEHKRNRRKEREQAVKEKKRTAAASAAARKAELDALSLGRVDKAKFGEVVQRPPILGDAAMKSRAKLKSGKAAKDQTSSLAAANDLSDYADKVRAAYEAIKQKRRGGVADSTQR
eukprot:TRINITY_DN79485_c0_g1_i1.p1 TRINITY_DN79485_c0_g1~~TRINITY_DN79485_c0_g1_i1.p1  ORF type:complete len:332 (-),score=80.31 TRINITY_DN79485_c0_g1_i1:99-1019(-)